MIYDLYWFAGVNGERMVMVGGKVCDWGVWMEWVGDCGWKWFDYDGNGDGRVVL